TCSLCHKTKMAEGSGHSCSYCSRRFCSRCGGRVPVKSNKVCLLMWVCNLCRKQQEIVAKSGSWSNSNGSKSTLTLNLEPIPPNGKLTLEAKSRRSPRNSISGPRSKSHALRKGNSTNGGFRSSNKTEQPKEELAPGKSEPPTTSQSQPKENGSKPSLNNEKENPKNKSDLRVTPTTQRDAQIPKTSGSSLSLSSGRSSDVVRSLSECRWDGEEHANSTDEEREDFHSTPDYSSCDDNNYYENLSCVTRDSGIDTGGSVTHTASTQPDRNEQPVSWQPSPDGKFLIGRMILNKGLATGNTQNYDGPILGLKVVGGKMTESGRLGAFITKVKHGSLADVVGHLRPGDEVVMWNEHCLQNASFDDVYEAVLASKFSKLVELMVSRKIEDTPRIPDPLQRHPVAESSSSSFESQKRDEECNQRFHTRQQRRRAASGKIQVRLWLDPPTQQLYVTVLQATGLTYRDGGLLRNPYIKMHLLPDRSESSKRRSKTAKKTLNPAWNQSFVYGPIRRQDLGSMALEITLWDLDRSVETNNHFLGELLIDLGLARLDDTTQWFELSMESNYQAVQHSVSHYDYPMERHRVERRRISDAVGSRYLLQRLVLIPHGHSQSCQSNLFSDRSYYEQDPSFPNHTHQSSPALVRHRVDPTLTHRYGNPPLPHPRDLSPRRRGDSPGRRMGVSPSITSIHHSERSQGEFLPGGRRVLPPSPQNMRMSKTGTINPMIGSVLYSAASSDPQFLLILAITTVPHTEHFLDSVDNHDQHSTARYHQQGYPPSSSYSKDSIQSHDSSTLQHNFKVSILLIKFILYIVSIMTSQYVGSSPRPRRSSVGAHSSESLDSSHLNEQLQLNGSTHPDDQPSMTSQSSRTSLHTPMLLSIWLKALIGRVIKGATKYFDPSFDLDLPCSTNQRSEVATPNPGDKISKSVSLGANLHEKNQVGRFDGIILGNSLSYLGTAFVLSPNISSSCHHHPHQKSTPRPTSCNRAQSTDKPEKKKGKLTSLVGIRSRSQSSNQISEDLILMSVQKKLGNSPRSSEFGVQPELSREGSRGSASGSLPSLVSESSSTVGKTLQDFVGGLGPGQVIGRQTLAASSLGDLELSFYETRGQLEVQVIRARNLVPKANSKVLPAPYVKVYLMFGMQCISKKKTKIARRTLDPVFHQTMNFDPTQYGHCVQVIVWGDYGRMDHKAFMGVAQVKLENLDLSRNTIGWYRLFPTTSLIDAASLGSTRPGSMTSLDSEATTMRN
uniref:Uncharacterized protein n=1 Tax=Ciona savignyi TaxID=51511 RepID=H2ZJS0_CIOSA